MSIWFYIGLFLLFWVVYDLITGTVWIHRKVDRRDETSLYWFILGIYTLLGLWCLMGS